MYIYARTRLVSALKSDTYWFVSIQAPPSKYLTSPSSKTRLQSTANYNPRTSYTVNNSLDVRLRYWLIDVLAIVDLKCFARQCVSLLFNTCDYSRECSPTSTMYSDCNAFTIHAKLPWHGWIMRVHPRVPTCYKLFWALQRLQCIYHPAKIPWHGWVMHEGLQGHTIVMQYILICLSEEAWLWYGFHCMSPTFAIA